ncbi:MAG: hypothetical protein WB421_17835 [Terriglobales bacterium]
MSCKALQPDLDVLYSMGAVNYVTMLNKVTKAIAYLQSQNPSASNPQSTSAIVSDMSNFSACRFLTAFIHLFYAAGPVLLNRWWSQSELETYIIRNCATIRVAYPDLMSAAETNHGSSILSLAIQCNKGMPQ